MRITLVNPNYDEPRVLKFMGLPSIPIGMGYLAACIEKAGYDIQVVDAFGYKYTVEQTISEIKKTTPDIVGISCVTCNIDYGIQIATEMRKSAKVIMGGTHPSLLPESLVDYADIIIYGEGEKTILEILEGKELSTINGLAYKENGKIIKTQPRKVIENLDEVPFPARHLFPMDKYKQFGTMMFATMMTSRGCPMSCNYCTISQLYPRWRGRSPKNVVDEMEYLVKEYHVKGISFVDEDFLVDLPRALAICDEIDSRKLKVWWGMQARVDRLPDLETMKRLAKSGCECLLFGVESAEEKTMKKLNRNIPNNMFYKARELGKKSGMRVAVSSILGFPGESEEDVKRTIKFVLDLDPDYVFFGVPTPFPGTKFYKTCEEQDIIKEKNLLKYTIMSPIIETEQISLQTSKKLLNYAYRSFYFRPIKMLKSMLFEIKRLDKDTLKGFMRWSFGGFLDSKKW